ncbi:UNVERIFIED_CONTAM: hypothetical protein Sindi_1014700 [Sesamum indicum]
MKGMDALATQLYPLFSLDVLCLSFYVGSDPSVHLDDLQCFSGNFIPAFSQIEFLDWATYSSLRKSVSAVYILYVA